MQTNGFEDDWVRLQNMKFQNFKRINQFGLDVGSSGGWIPVCW